VKLLTQNCQVYLSHISQEGVYVTQKQDEVVVLMVVTAYT